MTAPKSSPPAWPLGSLSPSKPGRNHVQPQHGLPPADKILNATSREPLDMAHVHRAHVMRPGSDHSALPSKGGC